MLIGAYDNAWTMRLTPDLPFGFEYDNNHVRRLVDRKNAERKSWTLQWEVPHSKLAQDYAIVARIHGNVTEQPVIVLAGILGQGTEAAGELVSNPIYLNAILEPDESGSRDRNPRHRGPPRPQGPSLPSRPGKDPFYPGTAHYTSPQGMFPILPYLLANL